MLYIHVYIYNTYREKKIYMCRYSLLHLECHFFILKSQ